MNEFAVPVSDVESSFGIGFELSLAGPSQTPVIEPLPCEPV
jgi:hypothetical protein